jgi:hypothetical protein
MENMAKKVAFCCHRMYKNYYELSSVKGVSVPHTNLYGKLVIYLIHLQSREVEF